jgi:hypothetical protein
MTVEKWWNDTDSRKLKESVKKLSQCHFVHHKIYTDCPRRKTELKKTG